MYWFTKKNGGFLIFLPETSSPHKTNLYSHFIQPMSLIPVRCFSCGSVLADKWVAYQTICRKQESFLETNSGSIQVETNVYFSPTNSNKSVHGKALDSLQIHNACCRRVMLTHVDIW
jgi:DNA-directed RNA polymerase subunit N (RpoN/RPB10)